MSEIQDKDYEIQLDLYTWEKQIETTNSLEEVYGYSVFSKEFAGQMEDYAQRQGKEHEEIFQSVWNGKEKNPVEEAFQAVFYAETETVIKADYGKEEERQLSGLAIAGFVLCGMMLTGSVLMMMDKSRKEKKEHEADDYSLRSEWENT